MNNHLRSSLLKLDTAPEPVMGDPTKLFQLLQVTRSIGSWEVDITTGDISWSPTVFLIHGMPEQSGELNLESWIRLYHPQDAKTLAWLVMEAIEKKCGFTYLLRLVRGDGQLRLLESAAAVGCDKAGNVSKIFGFCKDVTDQCSAKDTFERRNQLLRSIIQNSPSPVAILDSKMRYLDASPTWKIHFGLSQQANLRGRGYYDILPMTDAMRGEHEHALNGETVSRDYVPISDKYRSQETERIVIFPWYGAGGKIGGIMIMLTKAIDQFTRERTLAQLANLMSEKAG